MHRAGEKQKLLKTKNNLRAAGKIGNMQQWHYLSEKVAQAHSLSLPWYQNVKTVTTTKEIYKKKKTAVEWCI